MIEGLFAYPSKPEQIGSAVQQALVSLNAQGLADNLHAWPAAEVAGRFLIEPILKKIDTGKTLFADITKLNFNVTFEIGYAIGRGKPIYLVKNAALNTDDELVRVIGIFDTLGYREYTNSQELEQIIRSDPAPEPLYQGPVEANRSAPVFLLQARDKTDAEITTASRIKKARINYRTYDPEEHGRLSSKDAIEHTAQSLGVVALLLPVVRQESEIHNMRAAFVAGLAHGMEKPLLLLQEGEEPVPLDYRDLVAPFKHPDQIHKHIAAFATDISGLLQAEAPVYVKEPQTFLEILNFGASSAENELHSLAHYYLETDEFRRALRGEVRIVTGRKGVGKTALFFQLRNRLRSAKDKVVLDLKPEGFQLLKMKERVLDYLEEGARQHVVTAFWEYLLLLEVCQKVLVQDQSLHMRDTDLFEPYQRLEKVYLGVGYDNEGDFAERMLRLIQNIADNFLAEGAPDKGVSLNRARITEIIHQHDLKELRESVAEYLKLKDSLWILFDNLDKGWPPHGVTEADVSSIRSLLGAVGNLERQFARAGIEARGMIFIRNDVYELLVEGTSDRGKVAHVNLDWTDENMLRELLRRRLVYSGIEGDPTFDEIWQQIATVHIRGEESSQYLIDRCLMRPRSLIELVSACRSHAVNLGHPKIGIEDILAGERIFSSELIQNIAFEIGDVLGAKSDIFYAFIECPVRMKGEQVLERLARVTADDPKPLFDLLVWHAVLGVVRGREEVVYIYDVNYDLKRLLALLDNRGGMEGVLSIHPAFWTALEVTGKDR